MRVNGHKTPDKIEFVGPDKGFSKNIGTLLFCVDVRHFAVFGVNDLGTPSKVDTVRARQMSKLLRDALLETHNGALVIFECQKRLGLRSEAFENLEGPDAFQRSKVGRASCFKPMAMLTTSASVVLVETQSCFFDTTASGKNVEGPTMATTTPEVLFAVDLQPAKSASANKPMEHISGGSPTYAYVR